MISLLSTLLNENHYFQHSLVPNVSDKFCAITEFTAVAHYYAGYAAQRTNGIALRIYHSGHTICNIGSRAEYINRFILERTFINRAQIKRLISTLLLNGLFYTIRNVIRKVRFFFARCKDK